MATLKISDLSVGDWVEFMGELCKVLDCGTTIVTPRTLEFKPRLTLSAKYDIYDCVDVDKVTPIPITAEILGKSGFVKNGEYNEWSTGNWDDIPFIGISLSRQSMRIKNLGTDIFIENKVVYIHQLQHALRLAGIDKEINL